MAKVYKGTERVDKFFKHYGVKGMKWKNHRYKNYEEADRKAYLFEQQAKKETEGRRKDEALDAAARKRSVELNEFQPVGLNEVEMTNAKRLNEFESADARKLNERDAKAAAASYISPTAKKRISEDYVHGVINRRLKQNKQAAENAAKNAAGGAGNTTRIKDEITRAANERAAKERAGRADNGPGRKTPTSESEARTAAASYVSPALKKRIAAEYEEGLARNERNAKNVAGGAGKAAIDYSERKRAEREAKNAAGGAGDVAKKKIKEKKSMEEIYDIVSKARRSRK